ncbi:type 2 lanthipeptide synthetase LanM [Enterococcus rivorum]|uniref:type 2 lanthipeptide synthetase LanM n=1 Tax=Enterococcus rivorum TaxID=762845 RepID=UPI00363F37DE
MSQIKPVDFTYFIRFHMSYFRNQLEKQTFLKFRLDEERLKRLVEHAQKDLLSISLKTLIFDLHEQKKTVVFGGDSSAERFRFYLIRRFSTVQAVENFLEEYPVLWRLLAERLQFHIDNFIFFNKSLEASFEDLKCLFNFSTPANIFIDSLDKSDSHEKGKTVILFEINEQKYVFKFKNLTIGQQWNKFLSIIEQKTGSSFYQVKRFTATDYTIEEFIESVPCMSEEEVANYYYHFGEYTAICYFLCGNDFHSENIVACGDRPVIIDIETLLQNDSPLLETDSLYAKVALKKEQSVLSTSLLPIACFSNRIEPKANRENSNGIEINMSGFSGGKQLLPFKVLKLVEENTDNAHFEYVEHHLGEKENIPILKDKKVNPMVYVDSVMKGFIDQYDFFVTNKQFLIRKIKELFGNTIARCILKPTQQYYDMLNYATHSSCMRDYLEREKLFENQWVFSYKNKLSVNYEIEDLLTNDVPIFFTNVSKKNLFTSRGEEIKNYYSRTALDRVQNRIEFLSEEDKNYQLIMLNTSLKNYCNERFNYLLSDSPKKQLEDIVQHILKRGIMDNEQKKILFLDFILENGEKTFDISTIDFYDGLAGIYVFFLYYNNYYSNPKMRKLIQNLENSLFNDSETQLISYSVYTGKLSMLVALYYRYLLRKDKQSLALALTLVERISNKVTEINYKVDWLTGTSGLIKLLAEFYKLTNNIVFIRLAKQLALKIKPSKVEHNGLSHGYSGLIVALNELRQLLNEDHQYAQMIQECLMRERSSFNGKIWKDLRENVDFTIQWCHGCTGIGLARLELMQSGFIDERIQMELVACVDSVLSSDLEDDCLCHGNTGSYIFLSEVYKTGYMDKVRNRQIYRS